MGAAKKQRTVDYFKELGAKEIVARVEQIVKKVKGKQIVPKKIEDMKFKDLEFIKENQDEHKVTDTG